MNDRGRTHWDTCWRERYHTECAIGHVERLETQLTESRASLASATKRHEVHLRLISYAIQGKRELLKQITGGTAPEDVQGEIDAALALHAALASARGAAIEECAEIVSAVRDGSEAHEAWFAHPLCNTILDGIRALAAREGT